MPGEKGGGGFFPSRSEATFFPSNILNHHRPQPRSFESLFAHRRSQSNRPRDSQRALTSAHSNVLVIRDTAWPSPSTRPVNHTPGQRQLASSESGHFALRSSALTNHAARNRRERFPVIESWPRADAGRSCRGQALTRLTPGTGRRPTEFESAAPPPFRYSARG